MQATDVILPATAWGSVSRRNWQRGGWYFYVDDSRFNAIFNNPSQPLHTRARWLCELNPSLHSQTPEYIVLGTIGDKRMVSRFWQERDVPIFVDLHVPPRWREHNLIGVPQGWRAYSTRGYDSDLALLAEELEVARTHAGRDDILMLVVGGGKKVADFCQKENLRHLPYSATKQPYSRAT